MLGLNHLSDTALGFLLNWKPFIVKKKKKKKKTEDPKQKHKQKI